MEAEVKLSVIIPCYNGARTLGEQLDALAAQEWDEPWELLLADNGSTDGSQAIAEQYRDRLPHLRIIDASARKGTSFARNTGVAAAAAEAIVFCDADDVIAPGWVAAIGNALQKNRAVASRFDYTRLNTQQSQEYMKGNQASGLQQLWYPPYAFHAGGCGLGVHKSVHTAVGGFDEKLRRLHDTDYCLRLQQMGIELKFVPDALIYIRNRENWQGVYFQGRSWAKYNTWLYKQYRGQDRIRHPWRKYWLDWFRLAKQLVRRGVTPKWIFRFGWQVGLMQGSILYRSDPAVITGKKSIPKLQVTSSFTTPGDHEHRNPHNSQIRP